MKSFSVEGAQRLADLVVERLDLRPPVDVSALVAQNASIHDLPEDVPELDAVLIGLDSEENHVFVNRHRTSRRQRFTMAHELGHILLPWHQAHELICEADGGEDNDDPGKLLRLPGLDAKSREIRGHELEADAFAARTLVPKRFVDSIAGLVVDEMLQALETADVSTPAGMRSLADCLPAGYVFAMLDDADRVDGMWRSGPPRSGVPTVLGITRGEPIDKDLALRTMADSGLSYHYGRRIWWARADIDLSVAADAAEWKPILRSICNDLNSGDAAAAKRMWDSVCAIGGALVSDVDTVSLSRMAALLVIRLKRRTELDGLVKDPRFGDYVAARAHALFDASRRKNARREN